MERGILMERCTIGNIPILYVSFCRNRFQNPLYVLPDCVMTVIRFLKRVAPMSALLPLPTRFSHPFTALFLDQ